MVEDGPEGVTPSGTLGELPAWAARLFGAGRFFVVLAVIGSFLAAATLYVYGVIAVVKTMWDTVAHVNLSVDGTRSLQVSFVELTDVFLLGTVLIIVSLGLYQLFLQPSLPVPKWFKIDDLDQLTQKLIEVVGVLLGVTFLAFVVEIRVGANIQEFGLATAAVIGALSLLLLVSHRIRR